MENQNLIENSKFYKSDRELDYSLKKEKLQNELLLLEEELEEASIIKKFSLKLKIVDKKMQIDLLELVIKEQKENEIAANGGLFANAKGGDNALKKLASEESE